MTLSARELAARRRVFRRRRAGVVLVIVLIVATATIVPRIAASAAAAEVRSTVAGLVAAADGALGLSSTLVPADASAALADARAAAAAGTTDEQTSAAAHVLTAAVAAFRTAAVTGAIDVLGDWSDAEKSVEDALYVQIGTLRKASPAKLPTALDAASRAADAVRASAQAYRDGIIAAAKTSSSQPTGGSVDAQVAYLLAHATDYNTAQWGDYNPAGGDCVNFASQGLLARGWVMDKTWNSGGPWKASKAWRSTPDLDAYLAAQGFSFSTAGNLDRVRVGDIGVFNWGDTGPALDHTMTVSRVEYSPDGPVISFASHNTDGQYRPFPATLTDKDSGSTVRIYSIP